MNCKLYTLEELATIKYGKNQSKVICNKSSYPILGTGGIMGYATQPLYDKPSVLIGRKGSISKVKYIDVPFWTVDTLFYTEVNENIVYPHFLYYIMSLIDFNKYNEGTTIPSLRTETLNRLEFSIPSLDVQKKILSILEPIDNKISLNNAINHNLQQQAAALFKEWFIDNPDSSSWREGTFSNLIERTISGDWGKDSPTNNNTEMVYCIRGADIPEVRAGNKGKMPIRYIPPKNFATKRLVDGDIVVEISGGSPTQSTGRAAVVSDSLLARYDKGMVCTNFCKALKPIAGFSMYVFYYWQYLYNLGVFFSYENGTTGIKNLDINGFLETESINIAPVKLIEKFNTFCQSVNARVYANGLENERLAEIRDMILPKLMSGEIAVSEIEI